MLNSLSIRLLWRSLNWLARLAIEVSAAIGILIAASIIILRYSFLPSVEQYHGKITDSLSNAIGHPVTIGHIEADWRGVSPHLSLTDVQILNGNKQTVLALQSVDASLSWLTLLTADLRLANLEIAQPELLLRRDKHGDMFMGELRLSGQGGSQLSDWLLNQSRMVVHDALIVWVDEWRDAPPLVLQQVNLHIESLFYRHSFALRALPPAELSTPLDVRGQFFGSSFDEPDDWDGEIFTQLDYTDVTAWRPWLDLPVQLNRGRGALRGWLAIDDGQLSRIVTDLDLRDVVARLSEDTPEMIIDDLRGRAGWRSVPGGLEISTKQLAMKLHSGLKFKPTDLFFRTEIDQDDSLSAYQIRANLLHLEDIARLAKFFPMPADILAQLDKYAPKGRLTNLDASWEGGLYKPNHFSISGKFENMALRQVGKMPGFSGLTVDVEGNESGGSLNVSSHRLYVDAPTIMREPLFFNTFTGQLGWHGDGGEIVVNVDNVSVDNEDLAGNMYGSYRTQSGTLGVLDLTARLTRGEIRHAARYTPLIALNSGGADWLSGALLAGHTEDLRIRIKGNLSDFPIKEDSKDVLFKIGGHARDAILEFDKAWPRIEGITGEFLIRGNKLEVISPTAIMSGAKLQNVIVTMPNITSKNLVLVVNGEAVAENDTFLKFIQQSPVRGYINGFTDGVSASGEGHLSLFLRIPLFDPNAAPVDLPVDEGSVGPVAGSQRKVQVSGNFQVQGGDIDLGEGIPWLRDTRGVLTFTESGMQANGVVSRIFGGVARIDVKSSEGGAVHATVNGRSDLDLFRKSNAHPLLSYLSGGADWAADISYINGSAQVIINSDLQGVRSLLPQPFDKKTASKLPLRIEKENVAIGQDLYLVKLGDLLDVRLERREQDAKMKIRGGTIRMGAAVGERFSRAKQQSDLKNEGVWIAGRFPAFSYQGWDALLSTQGNVESKFPLAGVNLSIENLFGYGKTLGAVEIDGSQQGDGVLLRISGEAVAGEVSWLPSGYEAGSKFSANLNNLRLEEYAQPYDTALKKVDGQPDMFRPGMIPAVEVRVENLQINNNSIGHFELAGHPEGDDWRLSSLKIINPDGSLSGDGVWGVLPVGTQTQVNLKLSIADAGKTLARSGYPDTVKGGSGTLAANLKWDGSPDEFKHSTLNGSLKLDAGKGRFLKMDPGAGKLLSILSLQTLPTHISLDFTDVFSEGFQFENIRGNATISNGVINTQDLNIRGSAAKITMIGSVDLNNETQDLRVRILPTIGESVSVISAFAAGPAVGIGTFIVSKVLGDPLDKFVSFEYNIDGSWSNPNVIKISREPAKPAK